MSDMYVKYVGHKRELMVQFPVPFVSKSAAEGEPVMFIRKKPTKVTAEQGSQLLNTSPAIFEACEEPKVK